MKMNGIKFWKTDFGNVTLSYTRTHEEPHNVLKRLSAHTILYNQPPDINHLQTESFPCSLTALLLLLCLTGAWSGVLFTLFSFLSSQHTGAPEGLNDPHLTYFDCFWEKLQPWLALLYWWSTSGVCWVGLPVHVVVSCSKAYQHCLMKSLCFQLNWGVSCLSKGYKFPNRWAF